MIDIYFTLSETEYIEAQKLYMGLNKNLKRLRYVLGGVLLLCALGMIAGVMSGKGIETLRQMAPGFVFVCLFLCFTFLPSWGLKSRFLKEKHNFTDAHLVIDGTGYRMEVPGIGGGLAEWGGMDGWLEGNSVFLLRSGRAMRLFPKAPLSKAQIEEVRSLLSSKLGPVGVVRKR